MRTPANRMTAWIVCSAIAGWLIAGERLSAESAKPEPLSAEESRAATIVALAEFNSLVGGWRGVGQPVRNSNKGAWSETAEWVWELKKDRAGIRCRVRDGKLLAEGFLTFDPAAKVYLFEATLPDETRRIYTGRLDGKKLTLETEPDDQARSHQIVITQLGEKRTLVLFQSRAGRQQQFVREGEVGYTREGTKLAEEGVDGPECIVTGGKGTMSLSYKGQTYWFCCTGCRDAFKDDPEGILAEAQKRIAKKRADTAPPRR